MRVGELLLPVAEAMREELLRASHLQADETIVPVQMHDGRGSDHPAYLWQYGTPGGETVFDFNWAADAMVPRNFSKAGTGFYKPTALCLYDRVGTSLIHVGC